MGKQRRVWEDLHDALVDVAVAVSLLGAWTEYHHLQGDGEVLGQAKEILLLVLETLDTRFTSYYSGLRAVLAGLENLSTWRFIAPLAEAHARDRGLSTLWWAPTSWSTRASQATGDVASRPAALIASASDAVMGDASAE